LTLCKRIVPKHPEQQYSGICGDLARRIAANVVKPLPPRSPADFFFLTPSPRPPILAKGTALAKSC
jgi:hypothetical protein